MNKLFAWLKKWMPICVGIATVASLVAIPLWLQSRDTRRQYVQMAIDILRDADTENIKERRELRVWAVKIVNKYAPVELTEEAKAELIEKGWEPAGWQPDGWHPPGYFPPGYFPPGYFPPDPSSSGSGTQRAEK